MVREHKLLAFCDAHPELKKALSLWMVDRSNCEITYPEAAEIFRRDMPSSQATPSRRIYRRWTIR